MRVSQRRLPTGIYWRRRLLVLAAAIALAWIALRVTGGGSDEPKSAPAPATTTRAAPTVAAPVDGTVQVTLASSSRACDPQKIRMTPTVEPDQRVDAPVEIGLVVSSTEKTPCTLQPADADVVAVISANKTPVWDSTVCKASLLNERVSLSPRWASLVTTTWSGRGSGGSCSSKEGFASPGTYAVQVGTLGGEPGKTTFTLKPKPKPKPAATPTDKTPQTKATPKAKNTTKPND